MTGGLAWQAALAYRARGWAVVPVARSGKRPLVPWQAFQERAPTEDEIRDWYARWPDAGVGIVTGAVSGLAVLDIDPRHGGMDSLRELERLHGALPHTIEANTGGGGRHVYFAYPDTELRNRTRLAPGIDLRAEGGLVIAPPSLHASGRCYEWKASHEPDETTLAPMPDWLLRLACGETAGHGHPLAYWREIVAEGVSEGARNTTIASLAGHLLWHGLDPQMALELLLAWNRVRCRPPLPDAEVAATVHSIAKTRARRSDDGGARGSRT
ncbi:MAG: bifunctional DNA primase/polymerase [Gammaproteobacteria bacterium]|nr:bifunctional DNA primase/polymerase [Gammaproteobacteria bacterium]